MNVYYFAATILGISAIVNIRYYFKKVILKRWDAYKQKIADEAIADFLQLLIDIEQTSDKKEE